MISHVACPALCAVIGFLAVRQMNDAGQLHEARPCTSGSTSACGPKAAMRSYALSYRLHARSTAHAFFCDVSLNQTMNERLLARLPMYNKRAPPSKATLLYQPSASSPMQALLHFVLQVPRSVTQSTLPDARGKNSARQTALSQNPHSSHRACRKRASLTLMVSAAHRNSTHQRGQRPTHIPMTCWNAPFAGRATCAHSAAHKYTNCQQQTATHAKAAVPRRPYSAS